MIFHLPTRTPNADSLSTIDLSRSNSHGSLTRSYSTMPMPRHSHMHATCQPLTCQSDCHVLLDHSSRHHHMSLHHSLVPYVLVSGSCHMSLSNCHRIFFDSMASRWWNFPQLRIRSNCLRTKSGFFTRYYKFGLNILRYLSIHCEFWETIYGFCSWMDFLKTPLAVLQDLLRNIWWFLAESFPLIWRSTRAICVNYNLHDCMSTSF